jgi:hypothetical protein
MKKRKSDKKKDPLQEIYDIIEEYEDGYVPHDQTEYEM